MRLALPPLFAPVTSAVAGAFAAVLVYLVSPGSGVFALLRCPLYSVTGIYCPGCGTTRSLHSLLHGDFAAALHNNALFMALVPFFAYAWVWWLLDRKGSKALPPPRMNAKVGSALCAVIAVFWLARNVGVDWLAPLPV